MGVDAGQVAVGAGCDEVILLVAALGLGPGRVALVHRPTYQLYTVAARNLGADVVGIQPRQGVEPDWDAFLEAAPRAHVAFICSPNNPTGARCERRARARRLRGLPGNRVLRPGLRGARRASTTWRWSPSTTT